MNDWLLPLLILLGAGLGWVAHDVLDVVRKTGRHTPPPAVQPEQRGELLHLDWSDQRIETTAAPAVVTGSSGFGQTPADAPNEPGRHLKAVREEESA